MNKFKSALVVVFNTVVFLAVAEFAAGVFFTKKQRPEVVYQYSYLNGYAYSNYIGFTSAQFPQYGNPESPKPAIAITGGSTAAGVGVQDQEFSYYKVLEKSLIESGFMGSNQMLNFGVPGYVSNQESATYKFHIFNMPEAPKAVISFTAFNDIYFYLFRTLPIGDTEFSFAIDHVFRKGYPPADQISERIKNLLRQTRLYGVYHYFTQPKGPDGKQVPIRLSSDFDVPFQPQRKEPTEERIDKVVKNFLDNCLSSALMAKHRGSKFIVLLQPNYYYGGSLTINENEWFATMEELQKWINSVKFHQSAYDQFYKKVIIGLEQYKKQGLLEYWDYRGLLKDAGPVYLDPVHFDAKGSKLVADQMAADLKKLFKFK